MAGQDIVQNMILSLGQSQSDRTPAALSVHYADIDERTTADMLAFTKKLAQHLHYYKDSSSIPAGNWDNFFPFEADKSDNWLKSLGSDTPAHLALLVSFLELYKKPQEILNTLTGKHLDFYYQEVLQLVKKSALPDRAHLLIELKKGAAPIAISHNNLLTAGKDAIGTERIYAPTSETVINSATIFSLRSLFIDPINNGIVRYAPIANSSDGLGGTLNKKEPKWYGFGHSALPVAETGFALASPILRMQEGTRIITTTLTLANFDNSLLSTNKLEGAFTLYLTGESSWLGPYNISPTLSGNTLTFVLTIAESEAAVIDYDKAQHGYHFEAQAPVMQLFLNADKSQNIGYKNFKGVQLKKAHIAVDVQGITTLKLESDAGKLNPAKAFIPFGPQPEAGSRFKIGHNESLSKNLSELTLSLQWKGIHSNLQHYYANYKTTVSNSYFTADISFSDAGTLSAINDSRPLFSASNATAEQTIIFSTNPAVVPSRHYSNAMLAQTLSGTGSSWAKFNLSQMLLMSPITYTLAKPATKIEDGFITLSLNKSFLHKEYRKEHTKNLMTYAKNGGNLVLLNEPYTPEIQSIKLSYKAFTDNVDLASTEKSAYANNEIIFYHLTYFGQMREHSYQRTLFDNIIDKSVSLMPHYNANGELLIGIEKLKAGDSISLLFQVAEGSADPDLPKQNLTWSVLCDNYWRQLGTDELISDSTNQLLTSGLVRFVIPGDATLTNTILPTGYIWLKASVAGSVNALSQLINVAANAIEVEFIDHYNGKANDTDHLATPLAAGSITKFKNNISGVKKITQPYASFGGKTKEEDELFHTRVSERLRHKERALTAWDSERIILEKFPSIYKVKCIPHSKPGHWLTPGNVTIIVIPSLVNKNAINPLQPKADSNTLSKIHQLLQKQSGVQIKHHIRNPSYQKIRLDFAVKFKTGFEFNYYKKQLNSALLAYLSPWAYDSSKDINFGGRVYKSMVIDFIDELEYIDYVTDFKLYSYINIEDNLVDSSEVIPKAPDAILVSDASHIIIEHKG